MNRKWLWRLPSSEQWRPTTVLRTDRWSWGNCGVVTLPLLYEAIVVYPHPQVHWYTKGDQDVVSSYPKQSTDHHYLRRWGIYLQEKYKESQETTRVWLLPMPEPTNNVGPSSSSVPRDESKTTEPTSSCVKKRHHNRRHSSKDFSQTERSDEERNRKQMSLVRKQPQTKQTRRTTKSTTTTRIRGSDSLHFLLWKWYNKTSKGRSYGRKRKSPRMQRFVRIQKSTHSLLLTILCKWGRRTFVFRMTNKKLYSKQETIKYVHNIRN